LLADPPLGHALPPDLSPNGKCHVFRQCLRHVDTVSLIA
jgi:hypothetical protein